MQIIAATVVEAEPPVREEPRDDVREGEDLAATEPVPAPRVPAARLLLTPPDLWLPLFASFEEA